MTPQAEKQHANCPVEIRIRQYPSDPEPVPGLFCSCHNKHLKWLSWSDTEFLLDELAVPVGEYRYKN
jgi:hypothetical protein